MRVLLITDQDFGWRERALLRRLQFGLMDEGVRTALASPRIEEASGLHTPTDHRLHEDQPEGEPSTELIQRIVYAPASSALGAQREARLLRDRVERALGSAIDAPASDAERLVIHALGEDCWRIAVRLAIDVAAALVLEVWRDALVEHVRRCEKHFERHASTRRAPERKPALLWSAADEALAEQVQTIATAPVERTPWGAHRAADALANDQPTIGCAALVTSGEDSLAVQRAIEGFAAAARDMPDALLFVDEAATKRDRSAWKRSAELDVLDRVAMLPDAEAHRELTLRCPALLMPDRLGERRSIALDAMAQGVVVIAAAESPSAWLIDGQTALLAPGASRSAWADRLKLVWTDKARTARLQQGALEHIRTQRQASAHVAAALRTYERALAAQTQAD